ncbi:hypothetical protein, partial [Acidovorax sp.]|uniref:hypothetical protein n=1 Tax=Acidovorax sp. TaxID=1872122 RepID=UPI0025C2821D
PPPPPPPRAHRRPSPPPTPPRPTGFPGGPRGPNIITRAPRLHGRFSTFSAFMGEKGFVRHMTRPEIDDLAQRVGAIYCTSCGAPVDIRKDHACPYCRAAFSLIDPDAVVRAMEGYAKASSERTTHATPSVDIGDALVALERDRSRAERERQKRAFTSTSDAADSSFTGDLVAAGVALVWALVKD